MSNSEDLRAQRNRERAAKLDALARKARTLPYSLTPSSDSYASDVTLIKPDCDLDAIFGSMQVSLPDAQTSSTTSSSEVEADSASSGQRGYPVPTSANDESETGDDSFDPDEKVDFSDLLMGPMPSGDNSGYVPEAVAGTEESSPIDDSDDFAFSLHGSELTSTVSILRMPSDRYQCIKVMLTKSDAIFSAFDRGCFAQRSIGLVHEPIGTGSEPVVFLLSSTELDEVSNACDAIVHIRVNFAAKRAWFSSGNFERPLVLQPRSSYLDRPEAALGTVEAVDVEDIDGTAWRIAAQRLGVLTKLADLHDEGRDLLEFKDQAAAYISTQALGLLKHRGLMGRRLVVKARWLPLLHDVLPRMGRLYRRSTTTYEVFHTNDLVFGFELISREPKASYNPMQERGACALLLPLSGFMQFLEANHVVGGKGFEIATKSCGACTVRLKGDRFQGRQVQFQLDGRYASPNDQNARFHLPTSPLLDLLKGSEPTNSSADFRFDFDRGMMHFALSDLHGVEAEYIIALERKPQSNDLLSIGKHGTA